MTSNSRYDVIPEIFVLKDKTVSKNNIVEKEKTCSTINSLCASWMVEVSTEECFSCASGDNQTKLNIIKRSMLAKVQRWKKIENCKFRDKIVYQQTHKCCGNTKEKTTNFILCSKHKNVKTDDFCFSCSDFEENS